MDKNHVKLNEEVFELKIAKEEKKVGDNFGDTNVKDDWQEVTRNEKFRADFALFTKSVKLIKMLWTLYKFVV